MMTESYLTNLNEEIMTIYIYSSYEEEEVEGNRNNSKLKVFAKGPDPVGW